MNSLLFLFPSLLDLLVKFINVLLFLILWVSSLRLDHVFSAGKIHNVWGCCTSSSCNGILKLFLLEWGCGRQSFSPRETNWDVVIRGYIVLSLLLLSGSSKVWVLFQSELFLIILAPKSCFTLHSFHISSIHICVHFIKSIILLPTLHLLLLLLTINSVGETTSSLIVILLLIVLILLDLSFKLV